VTAFFDALTFLTRVPLVRTRRAELSDVAAAQAWFVPVGLLIGLALLGVDRLCALALPPQSVAVVDVIALVVFTGALHLDGLADTSDGLLGAYDRERRLAIMRDTRAGTYAVVALVSVLALKWAGISALPGNARFEALVLTPAAARFAMLAVIATFPYARESGAGAGFHSAASPVPLIAGAAVSLAASVVLFGPAGVYVLLFATGCGLAVGATSNALVGGVTGDVYGAALEIAEACTFVFVAALAHHGWLDAWLFR
jgi:adenosylcobinamide-GDP ribazoletransferase